MKRLIPLILCVAILVVSLVSLTSCAVLDFLPEDIQKLLGYNSEDTENPEDKGDPENPEGPGNPDKPDEPGEPAKPKYSVTISGAGEDSTLSVSEGDLVPVQAAPTKAGYTFLGWYSGEALWNFETDKVTANTVIVAKWQLNVYNVTYELDGGVNYEGKPDTFDAETGDITLGTPTKPGYLFSGWYTDPEFENEIKVLNIDVYGDITIYAKWTLNVFNIKYELGGEGVTNTNPGTYDIETGDITLGEPVREGYKFLGWYTDPEFKNPIKVINVNLFANITLYAEWEIKVYNITYELYGGVNAAVNPGTFDAETGTLELGSATRPGYSFDGWYADPDYKTPITHINVLGDVKVYAKWKVKVYNITYNLNGGVNSPDNPTEFDITTGVITLGTPKRDGFAFKGWYTSTSFEENSRITVIDTNVLDNITVYASWVDVSEFFTYEPYNNRATITAYNGTLEELEIPAILDGFNVTAIDEGAFAGNAYLKKLIIPSTVETIAASAFEGCTALEELVVDCTNIGDYAFRGCTSLRRLSLGKPVARIGNEAFSGTTALTSVFFNATAYITLNPGNGIFTSAGALGDGITVTVGSDARKIPDYLFSPDGTPESSPKIIELTFEENSTCTIIGYYAFSACTSLKTVTIPESVTNLESSFTKCTSLETIYLNAKELSTYSICPFAESGNENVGMTLIVGKEVTVIPNSFMYDQRNQTTLYLDEVIFDEESVLQTIGTYAFTRSNIKYVKLPSTVSSVGDYAFYQCNSLEELILSDSFSGGDLYYTFADCKVLKRLEIRGSFYSVPERAFIGYSNLEELYFAPKSFPDMSASQYAFSGMASESRNLSIVIANTVTRVPNYLVRYVGSNVTSLEFESGSICTSIGEWAFGNLGIVTLTIPDSVQTIGGYAFAECSNLAAITFGSSLGSIGSNSFRTCQKVVEIYNRSQLVFEPGKTTYGDLTKWMLYTYSDESGESRLHTVDDFLFYVDGETVYLVGYMGNDEHIILPESYNGGDYTVYRCALYGVNNAKYLTISEGVSKIMGYAFCGLRKLEKIYFDTTKLAISDNDRTAIFNNVGVDTEGGTTVVICKELEVVPSGLISGSTTYSPTTYTPNITKVEFEEGSICTTISSGSFTLSTIKSITLPDSVTTISTTAFSGATSLEGNVYGGIVYIGTVSNPYYVAFKAESTSITSATIHKNTKILMAGLFKNCTLLESLRIEAESLNDESSMNDVFYNAGTEGGGIAVVIGNTVKKIPSNLMNAVGVYPDRYIPKIASISFEENSVCESIGENAFRALSGYTEIIIPDSVKEIGVRAFAQGYDLKSVVIGDGVLTLADYAFYNCSSMLTLVIGDGVTDIGASAFSSCRSLVSVTLGESVENIGDNAFFTAPVPGFSLADFKTKIVEICNKSSLALVPGSNDYGYIAKNAINVYTPTEGESKLNFRDDGFIFYGGNSPVLVGYVGTETELTLPEGYNGTAYAIIDLFLVGNDDITKLVIPKLVNTVGSYAFFGLSALTELEIGEDVTSLGAYAFSDCKALTSITIRSKSISDKGISDVFRYAGESASGISLLFGKDVTRIPARLFYASSSYQAPKLISVDFESGAVVESIGEFAFAYCSKLTTVVIPSSIIKLEPNAFYSCNSITSYNVYENGRYLGDTNNPYHVLMGIVDETATEFTVHPDCKIIGDSAFYYCDKLTSVTLHDNIIAIGGSAFSNCTALKSITLPASTSRIERATFSGCTSLAEFVIHDGITYVGQSAFSGCSSLRSIVIGQNVSTVESMAFNGCTKLLEVYNLSESFTVTPGNTADSTNLGSYVKVVHTSLEEDSNFTVDENGFVFFMDADQLYLMGYEGEETDISLPESVNGVSYVINQSAFAYNNTIVSVTIPAAAASIPANAFAGCKSLTKVVIADGGSERTIASYAFLSCTALKEIYIGDGVSTIATFAFSSCKAIEKIVIGSDVTKIEKFAINDPTNLVVYYKGDEDAYAAITKRSNTALDNATTYFYSVDTPTADGNFWHFDENGNAVIWE